METASVHVADLESGRILARVSPGRATGVNLPGSCWNAATDRIVFSLERDARDWTYSAAPDGRDLRRLSGRLAIEPSFAPDAGASSSRSRSTTLEGDGSIYGANADGTEVRRLTRRSDDRQPNWSPTGDRIVFERRSGQVWDACTIRPDGTGLTNVTRTRRVSETEILGAGRPAARVLLHAYEGHIAALVAMHAGGGTPRVTRSPGWYDGAPSRSPRRHHDRFRSTTRRP